MTERNQDKFVLKNAAHKLMREDEDLCGDNTHKLAVKLFEQKFGIEMTEDQIRFINSIDRARRNVFKNHPELDLRDKTKSQLEPADRKYYAEN